MSTDTCSSLKLTASDTALAVVTQGSALSLMYSMPAVKQVSQQFEELRGGPPLANTFLNFVVPDAAQRKRSRSLCCLTSARPSSVSPLDPASHGMETEVPAAAPLLAQCRGVAENNVLAPANSCALLPHSFEAMAFDVRPREAASLRILKREKKQDTAGQREVVKQQKNIAKLQEEACVSTVYTTIMLKNLPEFCSQADLVRALNQQGFKGCYNFCYLPVNFQDGSCRGYAFVNFLTHAGAAAMVEAWHGSNIFSSSSHQKPLVAVVAGIQGLDALQGQASMKKLRRVRNPAYRPFIARTR